VICIHRRPNIETYHCFLLLTAAQIKSLVNQLGTSQDTCELQDRLYVPTLLSPVTPLTQTHFVTLSSSLMSRQCILQFQSLSVCPKCRAHLRRYRRRATLGATVFLLAVERVLPSSPPWKRLKKTQIWPSACHATYLLTLSVSVSAGGSVLTCVRATCLFAHLCAYQGERRCVQRSKESCKRLSSLTALLGRSKRV